MYNVTNQNIFCYMYFAILLLDNNVALYQRLLLINSTQWLATLDVYTTGILLMALIN